MRSVPRQQCWSSDQRRYIHAAGWPGMAEEHEGPAFLNSIRRHFLTQSTACEELMAKSGNNIHRHVSTYSHAHDMLSIMRALGDDEVNYYGVSWGTALGAYFASLWPDRVGRMILEGICHVPG